MKTLNLNQFSLNLLLNFLILVDIIYFISTKASSSNNESLTLLNYSKKEANIKALNLLQNRAYSKNANKELEFTKQIKMLTKGVSSLNIVPADDTGLINLKLSEINNIYSFGLQNKIFKVSMNDINILELSKDKAKLNSQSIILNTVSTLGKIIYNYSYKVLQEVSKSQESNSKNNKNNNASENEKKYELVEMSIKQTQWRMIMYDNFNVNKTSLGWNYSFTTKCGQFYNILGGMYQISQNTLEKVITYLPNHKSVMIEMNVHFLGKWSGETLYIQIDTNEAKFDPKYVWSMRCENSKNKPTINMCGPFEYCKIGEKVRLSFNHFSNYMKIIVGTTLQTTPNEKSYGISDFRLYVK